MKNLLAPKRQRRIIKHLKRWKVYLAIFIFLSILGYIVALETMAFAKQLFSMTAYAPTVKVYATTVASNSAKLDTPRDIDTFTGKAVDEFFDNPAQQSEMRMIMHCLLYRETKHDLSKGHGDGGRAGGPLQFWQGTWEGYRKLMISEGYTDEISDRYNLKEAIRTTVWAIKHDRAKAWGPILRSMEGSTHATCPVPSFYK